jgi:plastocyanin
MQYRRRDLLATSGTALAAAFAGCSALGESEDEDPDETPGETPSGEDGSATPESDDSSSTPESTESESSESESRETTATVDQAVAAEWNAMRARLWDALSLGLAGDTGSGAAVAQQTFARFEEASGEYGAHEMLEETNEANYEEFEEALGELRTEGLQAGDIGRAQEERTIASRQLAEAQQSLVGETTAQVLDLQLLGVTVQNAAFLAAAGNFEAAQTTAEGVLSRFEEAAVHDVLESADSEAYETFEGAVEAAAESAGSEDAEAVRASASEAFAAALDGSYALADSEATAGAGHIAALQARGFDAAALASMGGPSTAVAHAAALTVYRGRAHDARWLAAHGETDRAATMVGDVFAHFEEARAHEALEEADHDAYEGFESGLSDLQSAIENGEEAGIEEGLSTVDSNLVTGIEALAGANAPLLEAAFFRARFADARERYRRDENSVAASIAQDLFERFEANELDFHETVESTSEELYHQFEEEHLNGLVEAFESSDSSAVDTHYEGVQSTLLEFETMAGSVGTVSSAEAAYMAARGFDTAVLDTLGADDRAEAIAQGAFEHFEAGAGGYHEALEEADHETYEAFEEQLGGMATAASDGEDVYPVAKQFNAESVASMYAIVGNSGGSQTEAAGTVLQDTFGHFEGAHVHELLEEADHNAYETFEVELDAYLTALQDGGDVTAAADSFARASQYAQFALVDAVEQLPLSLTLAGSSGGGSKDHDHGGESDLKGGPNVVEGVPEDADHVVDMQAVAFEPAELTISQGETVAWKHAAGEPHSVTAYEEDIPSDAEYWASGGFDSEEAARTGWENGKGAIASGQSYVHTFETAGTHEYVCIPHEAAGMVGTVIVE